MQHSTLHFLLPHSHHTHTHTHTHTHHNQMDLLSLVDKKGSECLNESDSHPFHNALTAGKEFLESDCDEQLILVLAFHQPVKLHSLQIVGPPDGENTTILWFRCVKYYLKKHDVLLQAVDDPIPVIKAAFEHISPEKCEAWISHSGYPL